MIFDSKANASEKTLLARKLFFRFYGNPHYMLQEGIYNEYKKLKIPKEIEKIWRQELFEDTKKQLHNETSIYEKIILLGNLLNYGVNTDVVVSIIVDLLNSEIDTFSKILLCEELKRCFHNEKNTSNLIEILEMQKKNMLSKDITVDEKYFSNMLGYDFSDCNIRKRINAL